MFLNETKPPLEEALAHYGVKGMKWGQRRAERKEAKAQARIYRDMEKDLFDDEDAARRRKRMAGAALALAGTAVTVAVLHKKGHLKVPTGLLGNNQAERDMAVNAARGVRDKYKNSKFANKTFRPDEVRNPLWTVNEPRPQKPKKPKFQFKDGPDFDWSPNANRNPNVGFNMGPEASARYMRDGAFRVHNMGPDVWDVPMLAITSGRK